MAPEQDKKRTGRKLVKRNRMQRNSSLQYPERLKFRAGDDIHEDVTASKGQSPQHLNQSVFSMIAAAGSKVDFHARFEEGSSDSEEGEDLPSGDRDHADRSSQEHTDQQVDIFSVVPQSGQQYGEFLADKIGRSPPKLSLHTIKEKSYVPQSSSSPPNEWISPISSPSSIKPRDAPVMSMMLHAQAQLASSDMGTHPRIEESGIPGATREPSSLATRLKEIFGFEEPEEVISGMWE